MSVGWPQNPNSDENNATGEIEKCNLGGTRFYIKEIFINTAKRETVYEPHVRIVKECSFFFFFNNAGTYRANCTFLSSLREQIFYFFLP